MSHELDSLLARVRQHEATGYSHSHAFELAVFEARIDRWPPAWGQDLVALVFGDFTPPAAALVFGDLGITIEPETQTNTVIGTARTVLIARVSVPDRSVASVKDAAKRLNLLVGVLSYSNQSAPIRWWCYIMSPMASGLGYTLAEADAGVLMGMIELLPPNVRRHVEAALYWLREPRSMLTEQQGRPDQLAVYAGHWNAFECLVEGVNILSPPPTLTRTEKNAAITARVAESQGSLDAAGVAALYREVVDPGLRERASHAIKLCAGSSAAELIANAFAYQPADHSLYRIRNAISHGTINVNDPETVMLVGSRFPALFILVRVMVNGLLRLNAMRKADAASPPPG